MRNRKHKKSEFLAILMQEDILLYAVGYRDRFYVAFLSVVLILLERA